jgi:hypothetical protein
MFGLGVEIHAGDADVKTPAMRPAQDRSWDVGRPGREVEHL